MKEEVKGDLFDREKDRVEFEKLRAESDALIKKFLGVILIVGMILLCANLIPMN